LCLGLFLLTCPIVAQELKAPDGLKVEHQGDLFRGRWEPVPGAASYQVWVEKFGRWSFNPKTFETSPFTSSFEIRVEDPRSRFKVRAVDSQGNPGLFSSAVKSKKVVATEKEETPSGYQTASTPRSSAAFDPTAPPPEPPTSLFAIWTEPRTIKLVWREVKGAKKYSVEELRDGTWTSVPIIEFPKPNNALIKDHPAPGPYKFRVRSVGANGRASEPSRETTASR